MATDALPMARAFEDGGFTPAHARSAAVAVRDAVTEEVETHIVSEQRIREIVEAAVDKATARFQETITEQTARYIGWMFAALTLNTGIIGTAVYFVLRFTLQ